MSMPNILICNYKPLIWMRSLPHRFLDQAHGWCQPSEFLLMQVRLLMLRVTFTKYWVHLKGDPALLRHSSNCSYIIIVAVVNNNRRESLSELRLDATELLATCRCRWHHKLARERAVDASSAKYRQHGEAFRNLHLPINEESVHKSVHILY